MKKVANIFYREIWKKKKTIAKKSFDVIKCLYVGLKTFLGLPAENKQKIVITDDSHTSSLNRGFFSLLREVLYIISLNGKKDIEVCYNKTVYNKKSDENIWEYCFRPILNREENKRNYRYLFMTEPFRNPFADRPRFLKIFHRIIEDRIRLNGIIKSKIDNFVEKNFKGKKVIGIHYRGADTLSIAGMPNRRDWIKSPLQRYFDVTDDLLKKGFSAIFLATDDEEGYQAFREKYGDKIFNCSNIRSSKTAAVFNWGINKNEPPLKKTDPREVLEESLIDCLLLAKCDYLIHGKSNLSYVSKYFNPDIPCANMEVKKYNLIEKAENMILYS